MERISAQEKDLEKFKITSENDMKKFLIEQNNINKKNEQDFLFEIRSIKNIRWKSFFGRDNRIFKK